MADLERLVARIEADISGLKAGLAQARGETDKTTKAMGHSFTRLSGPVGVATNAVNGLKAAMGALAVRELAQATRMSLDFHSAIKDVAQQTQFSTEALQANRYAATQLGMATTDLDAALGKMTQNLGKARNEGGQVGKVFRDIGVDIASVGNGQPALDAIIDGLNKVEDPARRAAYAAQIFGKEAGPKMKQFIDQGSEGLARLRQAARDIGAVISDDVIQRSAEANDELAALDQVIKAQLSVSLANFAPVITTFGQGFAWASQQIADMIAMAKSGADTISRMAAFGFGELFVPPDLPEVAAPEVAPPDTSATDEIIRKQRDLMRDLANDSSRASQQLAQQNIQRFSDLTAGIKVSYEQALGYSRNYYIDETALENSRYAAQLEAFREKADELNLSAEDRAAAREQIEVAHQANLLTIQNDGQAAARRLHDEHLGQTLYKYEEAIGIQRKLAEDLQNFEKLTGEQRMSTAMGLAEGLLSSLGKTSRKSFELSKKLAIADAVVNTYRAAAKAIGESNNIYVGLAKAAVALAFGFAQVRAIQATQFGGGGAGGGPGGARTVAGQLDEQEGGSSAASQPTRTIIVQGLSPEDIFSGRQLAAVLQQVVGDGTQLRFGGR